MLDVTEQVLELAPLRVRRRVKWGECDPAGVVYTARFSDYVISAFELFMRHLLRGAFQEAKDEHGFGTPCKALSLEFFASLRPDDEFDMTVLVAEIRTRTFDLEIRGSDIDGKDLFRARMTPITIKRGDRSRAIELPSMLRERLESYRTSCRREVA
jgi:acyl-CoA thioester hydrolase